MKTKLFILFITLLSSLCVSAQDEQCIERESHFFDRRDYVSSTTGDTRVILYEKQKIKPPKSAYREGNAIDDLVGIMNYIGEIIKNEFPEASKQEAQLLGRTIIDLTYSDTGEIVYYQIRFPLEVLEGVPNLEQHLYNMVERIKKDTLKKFKILSPGSGGLGTAGFYIRVKNIK